jgi:hypothetical protein
MSKPRYEGWIGVDLDGTLAKYDGWNNGAIGEPIPRMLARVKDWIKQGQEVRIFTARVSVQPGTPDDYSYQQMVAVGDWCQKHIGTRLPVTAIKDFQMICLYDDRSKQVEFNTGVTIEEKLYLVTQALEAARSAIEQLTPPKPEENSSV